MEGSSLTPRIWRRTSGDKALAFFTMQRGRDHAEINGAIVAIERDVPVLVEWRTLDGAADIDIEWTAATNAIPIARLEPRRGRASTRVAFPPPTELSGPAL